MNARTLRRAGLVSLVAPYLVPTGLAAQLSWPAPVDEPTVIVQVVRPLLDDRAWGDTEVLTGQIQATLLLPVAERASLYAELGLTHARIEDAPSSSMFANPRVGLLVGRTEGTYGEFAVTIPLGSTFGDDDYAVGVGFVTDPDRIENYLDEAWGFAAAVAPRSEFAEGASIGGRFGGTLLVPTEAGEAEVLGHYAGFVSWTSGRAVVTTELTGTALLSEKDLSFEDRSYHHGGLALRIQREGLTPEFFVRVPLDRDLNDQIDATVGLRLVF